MLSIGRFFPSDYLHGLNQGIVAYLLGWTLQMLYVVPFLDDNFKGLSSEVLSMIQEFPAHNAFYPIKHKHFEGITTLINQERKVLKASDIYFGLTDIVALTESWKLMTALFQLMFVIISGKKYFLQTSTGERASVLQNSHSIWKYVLLTL